MNKDSIKFGTDGWRAIIGKEFVPNNIARLIQAFCDVTVVRGQIYVGYDRRQNSESSAKLVAQVLASNGFKVSLAREFCPTPCISWMVKTNQAIAGVMVTASHNPPEWNGIKFKESYGGAASADYTTSIEKQIIKNDEVERPVLMQSFADLLKKNSITFFDPRGDYVHHLQNFVDVQAIKKAGFKIVIDPLYGAGTGYIKQALGIDVVQIHDAADTRFGGLHPEPIAKNLTGLFDAVIKNKASVGLATDGDADRIGACDEFGNYVNAHQIFALLIRHNVGYKKLFGAIVKSVSSTGLIDKICAKLNLPVIETQIGFKNISAQLLKHNALMGGEESGGVSLREHVHERDGVLNSLLLLEMMTVNNKTLGQLVADMDAEFGKFYYDRNDYQLTAAKVDEVTRVMARLDIKEVGGVKLMRYNTLDGCKLCFNDASWLLVRASGTEPLLRVYAEAGSSERVIMLLAFAKKHLCL